MYNLLSNLRSILLLFGKRKERCQNASFIISTVLSLTTILGCGGFSQKASMPTNYQIKFNENGGMAPYGTTIFLSNQKDCYVEFYVNGIENEIPVFPSMAEMNSLVQLMQTQQIHKINSKEIETYDRGGNSIRVQFDDQEIRISDMGSHYIKEQWKSNYSKIVDGIYTIAKKHVSNQLQAIDIVLDSSLIKEDWQIHFGINSGVFIGQQIKSADKNFKTTFNVPAIVGENKMYCNISKIISGKSRQEQIVNWSERIVVSKATEKITLALVKDSIKVFYNDELPKRENETVVITNSKFPRIIETQNLKNHLLSPFIQIAIQGPGDDPEYESFQANFDYHNEQEGISFPLFKTTGSFIDTYADIHYTLIETGLPKAPYLLFFSGQAGDEFNTKGKLVLFSKIQKISELDLHDGNRIHAELLEVLTDKIKVKEALMCHQAIQSTIAFTENGLERLEGFFEVNSVYPNNNEIPTPSHLKRYVLKSDLKVTQEGEAKIYKEGEAVELILQRVDYNLQAVFFKVNEEAVYMDLEGYKMHELIQSMYGAKCEMG